MTRLLTIAIPTFNRATHLDYLLTALKSELHGLEEAVEVIVSDNASQDGTADIMRAFATSYPSTRIIRNTENIGAEANLAQCFLAADGDYVWILGDDDIPKAGVIAQLVEILKRESPDLVQLGSEWTKDVRLATQGVQVGTLDYAILDRVAFTRKAHVWLTFISGVVIKRQTFADAAPAGAVRRFDNTCLIQLGWVLPVLKSGARFMHVPAPCILATAGNTGGYAVLTTFGVNFSRIVGDVFGKDSPVYRAMIRRLLISYLPQLLWSIRFEKLGKFSNENPWPGMRGELGKFAAFWGVLIPMAKLPKPLAHGFFMASRIIARTIQLRD